MSNGTPPEVPNNTPPAAPPAGAPPASPPPSNSAWYDGFQNADHKGYVQNKGFKDPEQVVESYRNLEKAMGVPPERIIKLPEVLDSKNLEPIYNRLGRPEKPDGYAFPKPPEGQSQDEGFVKSAQSWFHELGLSKAQGEKLAEKWNEHTQGIMKTQLDNFQASQTQQQENLKREWGAAYEKNLEAARNAAKTFGMDAKTLDALGHVMGYDAGMKFVYSLAQKLGEDTFITPGVRAGSGVMTPEEAKWKIKNPDPEFAKRVSNGDATALREWSNLHKMAYPDLAEKR